jgi:hypothetical protein
MGWGTQSFSTAPDLHTADEREGAGPVYFVFTLKPVRLCEGSDLRLGVGLGSLVCSG